MEQVSTPKVRVFKFPSVHRLIVLGGSAGLLLAFVLFAVWGGRLSGFVVSHGDFSRAATAPSGSIAEEDLKGVSGSAFPLQTETSDLAETLPETGAGMFGTTAAPPQAVLETLEHDFGSVNWGEVRVHEFVVRNEGGSPLTLKPGPTTCRCTLLDLDENPIPPGGTGKVAIQFSEEKDFGPFVQEATVLTNDPERPRLTLRIRGVVGARLAMSPDAVVFANVSWDEPVTQSVTLYSQHWPSFQLELEKAVPESLTCFWEPAAPQILEPFKALSGYRIFITVPPGGVESSEKAELVWKVTPKGEASQTLVVPINAPAPARMELHGAHLAAGHLLYMGRIVRGQERSREFFLKIRDRFKDIQLNEVTCEPEWLRVSMQPEGDKAGLYRIRVTVPANAPQTVRLQSNPGNVLLKISHPICETIQFQVVFAVLDRDLVVSR